MDPLSKSDSDENEEFSQNELTSSSKKSNVGNGISNSNTDSDLAVRRNDLFVTVGDPQKHTTAMESFITFQVTTTTSRVDFDNDEFVVRRRYNDFLWLKQQFEFLNISSIIPPLPEKHSLSSLDRFNMDFIVTRQFALQQFMSRVVEHPKLSTSPNLKAFLSLKASEFKDYKKQSVGFLSRVSGSIHNISASIMLKDRPDNYTELYTYAQNFGDNVSVVDKSLQKVFLKTAEYGQDLNALGTNMKEFSNIENSDISQTLNSVASAMLSSSDAINSLLEGIENSVLFPLKEYSSFSDSIRATLRRRDGLQSELEVAQHERSKKQQEKENLRSSSSSGSWSLMSALGRVDSAEQKIEKELKLEQKITQLDKSIEELKEQLAVLNKEVDDEIKRWSIIKNEDFRTISGELAKQFLNYHQKCIDHWLMLNRQLEDRSPRDIDACKRRLQALSTEKNPQKQNATADLVKEKEALELSSTDFEGSNEL